MKADITVAKKQ